MSGTRQPGGEFAQRSGASGFGQDGSRLSFDIVEDAGDWSLFADIQGSVGVAVRAVAASPVLSGKLPEGALEVAVVLSDDASVARLNGKFRGRPKPTNVLSFPAPASAVNGPVDEPSPLGDIVLAVETIRSEAAASSIPPVHHLQHLVVHGLLHLAGFDHIEASEAEEMEALETEILAAIGVPDPYAGIEADIARA